MDYTQNLHLPQWEETDRIQMDDFNDAMGKIDAAMPRIASGSYVGTGTYGEANAISITFPFVPKFFMISTVTRKNVVVWSYGSPTGSVHSTSPDGTAYLSWNGATLTYYGDNYQAQMNDQGTLYQWCAFG